MGERWVRPALVAREAPPHWRLVWPFRVAAALALVGAVLLLVLAYTRLNDAAEQDPGLEAQVRATAAR